MAGSPQIVGAIRESKMIYEQAQESEAKVVPQSIKPDFETFGVHIKKTVPMHCLFYMDMENTQRDQPLNWKTRASLSRNSVSVSYAALSASNRPTTKILSFMGLIWRSDSENRLMGVVL